MPSPPRKSVLAPRMVEPPAPLAQPAAGLFVRPQARVWSAAPLMLLALALAALFSPAPAPAQDKPPVGLTAQKYAAPRSAAAPEAAEPAAYPTGQAAQ